MFPALNLAQEQEVSIVATGYELVVIQHQHLFKAESYFLPHAASFSLKPPGSLSFCAHPAECKHYQLNIFIINV